MNLNHRIKLPNTCILAKKWRSVDRFFRKVTEIELHSNINREDGFSLGRSWKQALKENMTPAGRP
jgi:hypothetical protein